MFALFVGLAFALAVLRGSGAGFLEVVPNVIGVVVETNIPCVVIIVPLRIVLPVIILTVAGAALGSFIPILLVFAVFRPGHGRLLRFQVTDVVFQEALALCAVVPE